MRWCALWRLIVSLVALNCVVPIEQVNSKNDGSDDDSLALALRPMRFRSASLYFVCSLSDEAILMRQRHFDRSCAICSHESGGMLKSFSETFRLHL